MKTFFLEKGLVILCRNEHLELVSRCEDELYFEALQNGRREKILENDFWSGMRSGEIQVMPAFSSPKQLILEDQSKTQPSIELVAVAAHHQEEAIRRHQYVARLIEAGVRIGQKKLIEQESKRIAVTIDETRACPSVTTLRRWWQAYLNAEGDAAALVSKNAVKSRSLGINSSSEAFLQQAIEDGYLCRRQPSVISAYRDYKGAVLLENHERESKGIQKLELVSEKTFYNRIYKIPKSVVNISRLGRQQARMENRMIQGHMPAEYPLDVVEIDHTPMNLYVIDDRSYLPLGRPWLTAIKDRKSGVLLGFYISFQATGLQSIFGAIKHSLHSHHIAYSMWDNIKNPWPAFGRGWRYVSDRGADFQSLHYRAAVTSLGAMYELCQRRTPWLKGSIERFFLTLETTLFEAIPGRTFASLSKRGDYDPIKNAVIRFSALVYLMHKWAADFHNITPNSRTLATPLEIWNEGILMAPQPYPVSVEKLNIVLGKIKTGKLSHEGIRYKRLNFASHELKELMLDLGVGQEVEYVEVAEDVSYLHVKDPRTLQYIKVPCTRPDYVAGLSHFQHDYILAASRDALKSGGGVDALIKSRIEMMEMLREQCDRRQNKTKVKLARSLEINSERVLQGQPQTLDVSGVDLAINNGFKLGAQDSYVRKKESQEPPVSNFRPFTWGV